MTTPTPTHPHRGRLGSDNDTEGDIGSSSHCLHRVNHQFAIQQTKFALTSDHACSVREKGSEICFWTKEWKVTNWLIRDQTKKKPIIFFKVWNRVKLYYSLVFIGESWTV